MYQHPCQLCSLRLWARDPEFWVRSQPNCLPTCSLLPCFFCCKLNAGDLILILRRGPLEGHIGLIPQLLVVFTAGPANLRASSWRRKVFGVLSPSREGIPLTTMLKSSCWTMTKPMTISHLKQAVLEQNAHTLARLDAYILEVFGDGATQTCARRGRSWSHVPPVVMKSLSRFSTQVQLLSSLTR